MPTTGSVTHPDGTVAASVGPVAVSVLSPGCRLRWNITEPAVVVAEAKAMIGRSRAILDAVAANATAGKTSWADIMQPLADDETESRADSAALEFYQHTSPHKARKYTRARPPRPPPPQDSLRLHDEFCIKTDGFLY